MPTVPATPRWEDFSFELVNLTDGTFTILTEQDILSADITWVPAPSEHKIEAGYIEGPAGTAENPSILAAAWNWGGWQAIRVVPYGDPTVEAWGLLVNARFAYSGRAVRDTFKMSIIPIEFLLHSRVIYDTTGTGFDGGNKPADDLAKFLVKESALAGTVGTDPDGNSRNWNWGTLAVQADASLCAAVTADYEIFEDYLDDVIEALSLEYGFVWELKPSVAAGALTFTFNTALAGGTDRTAGATRWVINDFAGAQPSGERTIDRSQLINAMHSRGITEVEIDAASIATYGRWEGIGDGEDSQGLAINLEFAQLRDGSNFVFANPEEWLGVWSVGDTVVRNNIRTGLAEANEVIGAVRTTWPERILSIEIRWGLKKGTYTQKNKKGAGRQGGGGGGRSTPGWAAYVEPVTSVVGGTFGTSRLLNRADHEHPLYLTADDTNVATITAGAVTIEGGTDLATVIAAGDLVINHSVSGVVANTYGDATHVAQITVNDRGHATLIADVLIAGVAPSAHDLLSASHGDTAADAPILGSIIVANATPAWDALGIGAATRVLKVIGGTAAWGQVDYGELTSVPATFAPIAHGIVSASHTGAGATLDVVGFSAANTLAVLTPSSNPGAASAILKSDASGYLRLTRLELGSATEYVYRAGAGDCRVVGATVAGLEAAGGYVFVSATSFYSVGPLNCGSGARPWNDVYIASAKGIIHADGVAAGKVLRADGTRYIPATLAVTDCSGYAAHTHTLGFNNIATGNTQPTMSGNTDNYTPASNSPVVNASAGAGTHLYYDATGHVNTTATGTAMYGRSGTHAHPLSAGVAIVSSHSHTYDKTQTPTGAP